MQRITGKIGKRHPLRNECLKDLRMVFRAPSDKGLERTLPTPLPNVMIAQMDRFTQQWTGAHFEGAIVLNMAALKEIPDLKKHMRDGCLSGIKPGRGTNRNEVLQKNINKIVSSTRYGVELA